MRNDRGEGASSGKDARRRELRVRKPEDEDVAHRSDVVYTNAGMND